MTYKQIEASREARLWIKDIIVPAAIIGTIIFTNTNAKAWLAYKAEQVKNRFKKSEN